MLASVADNVRIAVERQLNYVDFYTKETDAATNEEKMGLAPLTNSGCESQFAELDNAVNRFGGAANVTTLSNKHVIRKNRYFESEEWKSSDIGEKKKKLAWARGSAQAKKVSEMQQEWQDKVNAAKHLALAAKESKKRKKNERSLKLLEICKKHNGQVTP